MEAPSCVHCHSPMDAMCLKGVQLDLCPKCQGVWLDHGELDRLLAYAAGEAKDASGSGVATVRLVQHRVSSPTQRAVRAVPRTRSLRRSQATARGA